MSDYIELARKSGVGIGAVFIYSLLVTDYYRTLLPVDNTTAVAVVAVIPAFVIWTISKQFNKQLVRLIAEEKVAEAYVQIKYHQGSKEFYSEYDSDTQQELNKLDEKFYHQIINILSGIIIAVTIPVLAIIEFAVFGILGIVVSIAVAGAVGYTLGFASYRRMMEILDYSVRVSKVTNET